MESYIQIAHKFWNRANSLSNCMERLMNLSAFVLYDEILVIWLAFINMVEITAEQKFAGMSQL